MRICYFTPNFLPTVGGTEYVSAALSEHFHQRGHRAHVLTQGKPHDLDLPYPVTWYPKMRFPHAWPERVARHLVRLHDRERFDVFLVNYGRPSGVAAVRLTERTGVPTVLVSHGGDLYRESEDRGRPHVFKRTVEAYQKADVAIAISPHIQSLIREIRPEPAPVVNIPNGVHPDRITAPAEPPADLPDLTDRPFMLALGNLTEYKGFDDAVDAFALARDRLGSMRLVIAGAGKMLPVIQQKAQQHGLQDHVVLAGKRTGSDKHWLLQNCRFGLMPSIEEGHPIVGLELLAAGKAVACSLNPSFDEIFTDGVNAARSPARDPAALADAMVKLDRSDLEAMGEASRARVDRFAWPAIGDRYLEVMQQAIDRRQAGSATA
jgi:glycosyltransferase involved in cell wall biosynthesis